MKKNKLNLTFKLYPEKILDENSDLFNKYNWFDVSMVQKISEKFIEKYKNKVDWICISRYQYLSDEFIKKHIDKINIEELILNKNISKEIKDEIKMLKEII